MKMIYENPVVSFLLLDDEDIIRTSEFSFNEGIVDSEDQDEW